MSDFGPTVGGNFWLPIGRFSPTVGQWDRNDRWKIIRAYFIRSNHWLCRPSNAFTIGQLDAGLTCPHQCDLVWYLTCGSLSNGKLPACGLLRRRLSNSGLNRNSANECFCRLRWESGVLWDVCLVLALDSHIGLIRLIDSFLLALFMRKDMGDPIDTFGEVNMEDKSFGVDCFDLSSGVGLAANNWTLFVLPAFVVSCLWLRNIILCQER